MKITQSQTNSTRNYLQPSNIISVIDLTSLNNTDNESSISALCEKATTPWGPVAALCIYPNFVPLVVKTLHNPAIKIATVVNFPSGDMSFPETMHKIEKALHDGANEIDMVFPYRAYLLGEKKQALSFVIKAREICHDNIKLKIIIETGELKSLKIIEAISTDIIQAGADFIKTSTGKTQQGATLEAATAILKTIKKENTPIGIKISGGIRTLSEAGSYIQLSENIMGENWINPNVFRIGASKLLEEIDRCISGDLH